jgi:DNA-binding response OmpR family regulator
MGHEPVVVADGLEAWELIQQEDIRLVISDWMMPRMDGLELCRRIRAQSNVPIIVLSVKAEEGTKVEALDSGADDYVTKPFGIDELLARVRALLRRPTELQGPVLRFGKTELDEAKGEVSCSGTAIELRLSERRLLAVLMRRSGSVVAKSTIEDVLSEFGRELSANAVEVLVSRLRKALSEAAAGVTIETVRGIGYRLRLEDQP